MMNPLPLPALQTLIDHLQLSPHPEGGYFRETYRAPESIPQSVLPPRFQGERQFSTAIYFLLPEGGISCLHRIAADEVWHFYLGGPLTIVQMHPDQGLKTTQLGPDLLAGEILQWVVPAGWWFGAYCPLGSGYSLVGCTVAPGFDFADFEMAERQALQAEMGHHPSAQPWIEKLTPDLL
ncbi:cupin domain-containing protein [Synechocystis sp. LKSZ1]|uniref:cupin domain-containing protein n=1 Tax=Synechocystis sp. LKSZ1 TaxID=3144951 RepID=UPI00336BEA0D